MRQHNASVPIRFWHLMQCVPDLMKYQTCLYIGGNRARLQLVPALKWAGYRMDIMEIWKPYLQELRFLNEKKEYFRRILRGDVTKPILDVVKERYDLVVWWHGCEHVDEEALPVALANIQKVARRLAVCAAPHGHCGQGVTKDGNTYQRHRYDVMPEHIQHCGWHTGTLEDAPSMRSHLIGWWRPPPPSCAEPHDAHQPERNVEGPEPHVSGAGGDPAAAPPERP